MANGKSCKVVSINFRKCSDGDFKKGDLTCNVCGDKSSHGIAGFICVECAKGLRCDSCDSQVDFRNMHIVESRILCTGCFKARDGQTRPKFSY